MKSPRTVQVTVDTNLMNVEGWSGLGTATEGLPIALSVTTVNMREQGNSQPPEAIGVIKEGAVYGESQWGLAVYGGAVIPKAMVIGESQVGLSVVGGTGMFETILKVITNGSFPPLGQREDLTHRQLTQLRDAMIFDAHVRTRGEIFVTNDASAFIGKGDRQRRILQQLGQTRIMNMKEFSAYCKQLRGQS